jgi:hypothetical protein
MADDKTNDVRGCGRPGPGAALKREKSSDGSVWEHDFDMTYTKIKAKGAARAGHDTVL